MAQTLAEVDFSALPDALLSCITVPTEASANELVLLLETHLIELQNILDTRSQNDASRAKVKSGEIEVQDQKYKLNDAFIEETIKLSDDLDIDELDAANLLLQGRQLAERLDRTPTQAAIFIFHISRLNLTRALRLVFTSAADEEDVVEDIRSVLLKAVDLIIGGDGSNTTENKPYFTRCCNAMATTRKSIQKLREKEAHAISLGHHKAPDWEDWLEDLHVRLRFLTDQHEALASVLFCLARLKKAAVEDFKALQEIMKSFEEYNILVAHHVPAVYSLIVLICSHNTPLKFPEIIDLHKEMLKGFGEVRWALRQIQACVFLIWITEFNGLCNDPPISSAGTLADASSTLNYGKDINQPAKRALFEGAQEYLLALAADVCFPSDLDPDKEDTRIFLQGRAKQLTDSYLLSPEFKLLVLSQLERYIDSFIANMADVLKDLKLKEEEGILLRKGEQEFDLERFFFIITCTYDNRPDAALAFWNDPESNLFGFLMWASTSLAGLMATVLSYMMAAFSCGEQCSLHAHRFLREDFPAGTARHRRGTNYLSWGTIFQALEKYLSMLGAARPALAPVSIYRPPPPMESAEPPLEQTLVVDSYIRLIARIAHDCDVARIWLYEEASFRVMDILFELLTGRAPTQLLASIFKAIAAFLAKRNDAWAESIWNAIDQWAFGTPTPANALQVATATGAAYPKPGSPNLETIIHSVYPAEAFIELLVALVSPPQDGSLNDSLPFPENLGSSTRLSGIDPYVDFVMKDIYRATLWKVWSKPKVNPNAIANQSNSLISIANGMRPPESSRVPDPNDSQNILRSTVQLACLQFVMACLSSFNEDLILFAEKSNISIDTAIKSSSLQAYTKLHPFARVMEHLLSEKGIAVLFEVLRYGVLTHAKAPTDSPIRTTSLLSIEILELMLKLQSTYVNIVRPMIIEDESIRRSGPVLSGFATVEDAIAYHLDVVVQLGVVVEVGDYETISTALRVLEKLVAAPKLVSAPEITLGKKNRIYGVVENHPESRRIQFAFIHRMEDPNAGQTTIEFKALILRVIITSLEANTNEPSLAHLLLGFEAVDGGLSLSTEQGGIGSGVSLLHTILDLLMDSAEPGWSKEEYASSRCILKGACYAVLSHLWKSSLTTSDTMYVLRANKFLFAQFTQETPISSNTRWDGKSYANKEAFFGTSAVDTFCGFLGRRSALFEYITLEIRQLSHQGASTMVARYLSTLMGETVTPQGEHTKNVHVLDLLDFLELDPPSALSLPETKYFNGMSFTPCQKEEDGVLIYDPQTLKQLLELKKRELEKQGRIPSGEDELVVKEMEMIITFARLDSKIRLFKAARVNCLRAWSQLLQIMLESGELESAAKTAFMLQILQTILPKLDQFCSAGIEGAEELSSLAHFLVSCIKFDSSMLGGGQASDVANDRLFQLFRVSLRCIQSPMSTSKMREDFYNIAYRYLKGMQDIRRNVSESLIRHSTQTIKASGDRLLEVVVDDGYVGEEACKVIALLLLDQLVALGNLEGNLFVVESLTRHNFLVVLVDSIKRIGQELLSEHAEFAMAYFKVNTGFLERVAETRVGAAYVLNAGLSQALKESKLFEIDPDLGVGFRGPKALSKYYQLLISSIRVVAACVISRGPQNIQTIDQARRFLDDNRHVMLTVFKKYMKIKEDIAEDTGKEIEELTNLFVLLIALTDVVEG